MASPTLKGSTTYAASSASATHNLTIPANDAGDLIVIICGYGDQTDYINAPSGYYEVNVGYATAGMYSVWCRVSAGSETSLSVTTNTSASVKLSAQALVFSNASFAHWASDATGTNQANPPSTSNTGVWTGTTTDITWLAVRVAPDTNAATVAPTGFTDLANATGTGGTCATISTAIKQDTGTTVDPDAFTSPSNATEWIATTLAIVSAYPIRKSTISYASSDGGYEGYGSNITLSQGASPFLNVYGAYGVPGDTLFVIVASEGIPTSITIVDGSGSHVVSTFDNIDNGTMDLSIFQFSITSEITSLTVSRTGGMYCSFIYFAVDATATPVVQLSTGNSTTANPPSATITGSPAKVLSLAVAAFAETAVGRYVTAYPTGYSLGDKNEIIGLNNTHKRCLSISRKYNAATTEDPASFTLSSSGVWAAATILIAYEEAGGVTLQPTQGTLNKVGQTPVVNAGFVDQATQGTKSIVGLTPVFYTDAVIVTAEQGSITKTGETPTVLCGVTAVPSIGTVQKIGQTPVVNAGFVDQATQGTKTIQGGLSYFSGIDFVGQAAIGTINKTGLTPSVVSGTSLDFPTLKSSTTYVANASSVSHVLSIPTNAAGDLILIITGAGEGGGSKHFATPTGYFLRTQTHLSNTTVQVFYRISSGGESSVTFSGFAGVSVKASAQVMVFSGASAIGFGGWATGTNQANPYTGGDLGCLSATGGNVAWVAVRVTPDVNAATAAPTDFSSLTNATSTGGTGATISTALLYQSGTSIDPAAFTSPSNSNFWLAGTISVYNAYPFRGTGTIQQGYGASEQLAAALTHTIGGGYDTLRFNNEFGIAGDTLLVFAASSKLPSALGIADSSGTHTITTFDTSNYASSCYLSIFKHTITSDITEITILLSASGTCAMSAYVVRASSAPIISFDSGSSAAPNPPAVILSGTPDNVLSFAAMAWTDTADNNDLTGSPTGYTLSNTETLQFFSNPANRCLSVTRKLGASLSEDPSPFATYYSGPWVTATVNIGYANIGTVMTETFTGTGRGFETTGTGTFQVGDTFRVFGSCRFNTIPDASFGFISTGRSFKTLVNATFVSGNEWTATGRGFVTTPSAGFDANYSWSVYGRGFATTPDCSFGFIAKGRGFDTQVIAEFVGSDVWSVDGRGFVTSPSASFTHSESWSAVGRGFKTESVFFESVGRGFATHVDASFGFTTAYAEAFVMNMNTSAVSRYTSYPFMHIAKIGADYYGFKSDGVYKITGTTDEGAAIANYITTKETDFGVYQSKNVPVIYVATDATYTVSPIVDGATITATSASFSGRKAKLGRGNRGRYWAFKIQNITQVQGIEFMPETLQRRVK